MPRYLPWINLAFALPKADADMLLETFKSFTIKKSDLGQCCICTVAAPHSMRTQRPRCSCSAFEAHPSGEACPWRGRVRTCSTLNVANVDELHVYLSPLPSTAKPKLTSGMKDVARDWAAQGVRPLRVWHGLMRRFNLDEAATPPLATVQRFVHNYVVGKLGGSDLLKAIRLKIGDARYTGQEEESSAFTFTWRNDAEGKPIVGNGTDQDPFVVGITTKKLLAEC
jgi:hypothetical protein